MTLVEKDQWWKANVYKGNMPQLTIRAALTGMLLGGILSLTNLYVGAKTGWTLGVGITSVILAFAMFKALTRLGLGSEFTVLENNCMQSIATAAGYMTSPLIASLAAYMMVTNTVIPMWTTITWMVAISVLGVLFAFPLKKRFINDEQHPFPEGRAAGIVMDAMHEGGAAEGLLKAKLLVITSVFSSFVAIFKDEGILERLRLKFMMIPEYMDGWVYSLTTLRIGGIDLRELTIRPDTDVVMIAAGGLMGIRTGISIMVGALINYFIVVPMIINSGDIHGTMDPEGITHYGFKAITKWALWGGVAMMTTASLLAFFSKPQMIIGAFRGMFKKGQPSTDILKDIELPMSVFVVGIPIVGTVVVVLANMFFNVELWMGAIAIPLVFVFTLIAVHSTAMTSITPSGAMGKLTQLTYGLLAPGNVTTNLMAAGITGEVAGNASNLLMDIKPGYMLGAKPRQQAIGHVLGIFAGAFVAVPVFYLTFLAHGPDKMVTEAYPMPGAAVWKSVAEILANGLSSLPGSAQYAIIIGALAGLVIESIKIASKGKFWLTATAMALATVIPFNTCFAMFLGSLLFWIAGKMFPNAESRGNKVIVQNQEPICAGLIAGGALTGIAIMIISTFT